MNEPLDVGDVVRLNSDPSRMTVEAVDGARVHCVWFDCEFLTQRSVFPRECLSYVPSYDVDSSPEFDESEMEDEDDD